MRIATGTHATGHLQVIASKKASRAKPKLAVSDRQGWFNSAVQWSAVVLEIVRCADAPTAKYASNARLGHIGGNRLPGNRDYRNVVILNVVILTKLLGCLGDLGSRPPGEFLRPFESEQIAFAVPGFHYTVGNPNDTIIRLKLNPRFFPTRVSSDS